jgi:hypothetical protein
LNTCEAEKKNRHGEKYIFRNVFHGMMISLVY